MNNNDLEKVKSIQDEYHLQPLSQYMEKEPTTKNRNTEFPDWAEGDLFTEDAFKYIDVVLGFTYPVTEENQLRRRMAKLDIGTSNTFNIESFDEDIQEAIKEGVEEGFAEIEKFINKNSTDPLASTKMFGTRKFLNKHGKTGLDLHMADSGNYYTWMFI